MLAILSTGVSLRLEGEVDSTTFVGDGEFSWRVGEELMSFWVGANVARVTSVGVNVVFCVGADVMLSMMVGESVPAFGGRLARQSSMDVLLNRAPNKMELSNPGLFPTIREISDGKVPAF